VTVKRTSPWDNPVNVDIFTILHDCDSHLKGRHFLFKVSYFISLDFYMMPLQKVALVIKFKTC